MSLLDRLRAALRPDSLHDEIADELEFHREMKAAELQKHQGHTPEQARALAAQQFGPTLRIHEQGYDVRTSSWLADALQDARLALRLLAKSPSQSALLVATLALGIGVNTAIFSVVHAVLLDPLPFPDAARLVVLHQANQGQIGGVSYPAYKDWRDTSHSFTGAAVYSATTATLTGDTVSQAITIPGATVSANLFDVLHVQPLQGRLFLPEEDRFSPLNAALISDRLWRNHFQSSPDVLDQRLTLDGKPYRIVGVIPARHAFPVQADSPDFWTTVAPDSDPSLYGGTIPTSRGYPRYDGVIARLAPNATAASAQSELDAIAQNLARAYPKATSMEQVRLVPALEDVVGPVRRLLLTLYAGVACVLLTACVNVAGLLLVRSLARHKEFALRAALGARTTRLVRQALIENLLLALAGGIAGLLAARGLLRLFVAIAPPETPRLANVTLDATVLAYAAALSLLSGLLFGLVPAWKAAKVDLLTGLKSTRSSSSKPSRFRPGAPLITAQIALSMLLASGAALLGSSFLHTLQAPKGFDSTQVLTASVSLPVAHYPQRSPKVQQFYDSLLQGLRQLPGVQEASLAQTLPLSGQNNSTNIKIPGVTGDISAQLRFVDPAYFQLLRIPLREGRYLTAQDTLDHPAVLVVNQTFVRRFLDNRSPFQTPVSLGWGGSKPKQIVGIVGDVRHTALTAEPEPEMYVPLAQFPLNDLSLLIRTTNPTPVASGLRPLVQRLDPNIPVDRIRTLDDYLSLSVAPQRFLLLLLASFAASAIALSAIGLYGALSHSTQTRSREFGIRLALGSTRAALTGLVLRQGLSLAAAGIVLGLAASMALSGLLQAWLYNLSPTDPRSLIAASLLLLAVAVAASWRPARRATRIDPATSLRAE